MADELLQDDYVGELDIDADEEDALLEKGFENRHSVFVDRDGEQVHRYNFDDDEEEDILDIGIPEDLSLEYSAAIEKPSQRIVEEKDSTITITNFPSKTSSHTSVSSNATPESSGAENVPSSTSGTEEMPTNPAKDGSNRLRGSKKIVISNRNATGGQVARPNLQIFTKELRNRNMKKRLGGQVRQGNIRMRHPHPRFMHPNQMGPPPFRPPGPHFRAPGPPRQGFPPPNHQRSPGPWPRKILINPHFNQNQQNKGQWGGPNQHRPPPPQRFHQPPQTPPEPQWEQEQQPPQPAYRPFQHPAPVPQQPAAQHRFRSPPQDYDQQGDYHAAPPVITPEPQPYYQNQPQQQQQQQYRPELAPYQETPTQTVPPPQPNYGPPQPAPAAPYQQYQQYQQYPDQQPPPQRIQGGYDMPPQASGGPYNAPRQGPPPIMGPPAYAEHPPTHQNYPPPQPQYSNEMPPNQYAPPPRPMQDHDQFSRPPAPEPFHQPPNNPPLRIDYHHAQAPPRRIPEVHYSSEPSQNYAFNQDPMRYDQNQLSSPMSSNYPMESRPPPSQSMHSAPANQFSQPIGQDFPPQETSSSHQSRGNIKSRLGARVQMSPRGPRQPPHGSPPFGQKKRLNPAHTVSSLPNAAKQARYDQSSQRAPSRNILEVQTVSNLPDTTSNERGIAVKQDEEDEEMREYRRKIEAQKQFREKIFQIKEARRKQAVMSQTQTTNQGNTSNADAKPSDSRSVQPIATIVGAGSGKRAPVTGRTNAANVLAKRQARFKGSAANPGPRRSDDIVDPGAASGEPVKSTTQPRTLDERFSGLKSGVLVQPHEERFTASSNRTVLPAKSEPANPNASNIVIIDGLSASTKAQQLVDIASKCGKLTELDRKQSQKQAILKFKTTAGAAEFFKKYQRKMIDLSMITLTMGPPVKSS